MSMVQYCRPYPVDQLRSFQPLARWLDGIGVEAPDGVLYLWGDLRVTVDPLVDEPAFTPDSEDWRAFCAGDLAFAIPADIGAG
jgi:hypothetical protein